MPDEDGDLPNIDDLQIAAGAAAGKKDPVWPVLRKALGEEVPSDEEDEDEDKAGIGAGQVDEEMGEGATSQVKKTLSRSPFCASRALHYCRRFKPVRPSRNLHFPQPKDHISFRLRSRTLKARRKAQTRRCQTPPAPAQTMSL